QQTMQRWITRVLLPHSERIIEALSLDSDAHILLLLDAWAVHRSAEFRTWLQREHPRIHLVFVPANCTSKLQLADVALQRPFEHCIKQNFTVRVHLNNRSRNIYSYWSHNGLLDDVCFM
ncbi:MAG: hypothetical protein EOO38_28535, partial [Cytophagaceae bacterium]